MSLHDHYLAQVQAALRRSRRLLAGRSPAGFTQTYLASHCSLPLSGMHREMFADLEHILNRRDGRLAIAAPRGHAKTTIISLAFVLWCVLYEKEKFVLIVSATSEQANLLLKPIKDGLRTNALLIQDFPEVCKPEGARGQASPWRANRILLPNGAMIAAYGAGQGVRGAKHAADRPGLIVVDDIEDREQVISKEQRQKLAAWFNGTLLHAGRPGTNVVVVGTLLHHDSLLANLVRKDGVPGWRGRTYQAVESPSDRPDLWDTWSSIYREQDEFEGRSGPEAADSFYREHQKAMLEGTKVLWPELEDYHALMVMREREGRASFQAEKQNEPQDPEQCIFSEERFHYWDEEYPDEQALFGATKKGGWFYGACDPAMGRKGGRGDYTAIVILFRQRHTRIKHVIVADIARRSPDQTIEKIIQYAKMYPFTYFAVEANSFQELMVNDLRRRAREAQVSLNVRPVKSRTHKHERIAALEPEISQGRVRLCRRHHLLLDQLRQFPLAAHDDGPDALEMAVQIGRYTPSEGRAEIVTYIPHWARNRNDI